MLDLNSSYIYIYIRVSCVCFCHTIVCIVFLWIIYSFFQGSFTGTGTIIWLHRCSAADVTMNGVGKVDLHQTKPNQNTTRHTPATWYGGVFFIYFTKYLKSLSAISRTKRTTGVLLDKINSPNTKQISPSGTWLGLIKAHSLLSIRW